MNSKKSKKKNCKTPKNQSTEITHDAIETTQNS